MRSTSVLLAAGALVLACACSRSPSNWKGWIDEATVELKAQRYGRMLDACTRAFEIAHAAKNGPQAVAAYECLADAAVREGRRERAFRAFEVVLRAYDEDLRKSGAALRLRNNHGVALVDAGEKTAGVAELVAALDAYEGTPQHSIGYYRTRMHLVANLARAVRVFADDEAGVRVSTALLQEIQNHIDNERFRRNLANTLGTGDALAAIAEIVRIRGDPAHAAQIVERSKEQLEVEDGVLAGEPRRLPCDPVSVRSLIFRSCYASLR